MCPHHVSSHEDITCFKPVMANRPEKGCLFFFLFPPFFQGQVFRTITPPTFFLTTSPPLFSLLKSFRSKWTYLVDFPNKPAITLQQKRANYQEAGGNYFQIRHFRQILPFSGGHAILSSVVVGNGTRSVSFQSPLRLFL